MTDENKQEENINQDEQVADDSDFLISTEEYLKTGIHIGTKFKTKHLIPVSFDNSLTGFHPFSLRQTTKISSGS